MKLTKQQIEEERRVLRSYAFFDPRFSNIYGTGGKAVLALIFLLLLILGLYWVNPFKRQYNQKEVIQLWVGIALMPIGAFILANAIAEFLLKGYTLIKSISKESIPIKVSAKVMGILAILFSTGACFALIFVRDGDLWAYPSLGIAIFTAYCFVRYAWDDWYENAATQPRSV